MEHLRAEFAALEEEMVDMSPYLSDGEYEEGELEEVDENQSTMIVVDNIPKVPMKKLPKLTAVLTKIYSQFGKIEMINLPYDKSLPEAERKTFGFALVEFSSESQAKKAVANTNGWKLDKKHIFKVNHFSEVTKFLNMDENFADPVEDDYAPLQKHKDRKSVDLRSWLTDEFFRDQFVIRYAAETEISWCEPAGAPTLTYGGEREKALGKNWCEMYVRFIFYSI